MTSHTMLRIRSFVSRNYVIVVAALVVLTAVGGWMTYTAYAAPGTTTVERPVSNWESTAAFTHESTVTKQNPVYPPGTTLSNRSVYFTTITPELTGAYTYTYTARETGSVDGNVTVSLVLRGTIEDGAQTATLWELRQQLTARNVSDLKPGETVRIPFTVNMSEVKNQSTRIQETLGTVQGNVQAILTTDIEIDGTINGKDVSNATQHELPMRFEGQTYRVTDPGPITASRESVQLIRQPRSYGPLWSLGGPLLLLSSLFLLGTVGVRRHQNRLSLTPGEKAEMEFRDARSDYASRITTVRLPDEVLDRPQAQVTSLEDLVNIALDHGDAAIIEDPSRGAFYVVESDYCYTYTPPQQTQTARGDVDEPSDDDEGETAGAEAFVQAE